MGFTYQMMSVGAGTPMALELPQTNASNTKGTVAIDTSGFIGAAGANAVVSTISGVIDETQDNSGGSAGDLEIAVVISEDVLWKAVTTNTPTQAQMHDVVTLDASSIVDENDPVTTNTGSVKLFRLINTTDKEVLCRLLQTSVAAT